MIQNAPSERDVLHAFLKFYQDGILVAHNGLTFDLPFLHAACARHEIQSPAKTCLDTLRVCRKIDLACKDVRYSLEESLKRHKIPMIPNIPLHNALADALLTARLLLKFLGILEQRETDGIYIL
jgi:DNA polymerase-3 subunit alpha (Gram-positive type)